MSVEGETMIRDDCPATKSQIRWMINSTLMMMVCVHRESVEWVHEENSYLGERTR